MVVIKLKVNNINSTFYSNKLYESDAILDMLKALKAIFKSYVFKIQDITGQIPVPPIVHKVHLDMYNTAKMYHINKKKIITSNILSI